MLDFLITSLILTWILPIIGFIIGGITNLIYNLICKFISSKVGFILFNYLTFIGVVHHELSHALLGFLTGAKIVKITLFKPQATTLGSVELIYRGNKIKKSIQSTLSSIAPMICGFITLYLTYMFLLPNLTNFVVILLVWYVLISIVLHMTMSKQDLSNYWRGSFGLTLVIFIICYILKFSIVHFA